MANSIGMEIVKNLMSNSPIPMPEGEISEAMMEMMGGMPLRSMVMFSQGKLSEEMIDALLYQLNS